MKTKLSFSLSEIDSIAEDFLANIKSSKRNATVIGLRGNLGSGKTTFVQSLAKHLGIKEQITSPTFIIEKVYPTTYANFDNVVHIDTYRLDGVDDLKTLGFETVISDTHNLVLIEWPEKVESILPEDKLMVDFRFVDDKIREIYYEK